MIDSRVIFLIILFTFIVNTHATDDNGKQCVKCSATINNNSLVIDWIKVENYTEITRCDWIITVELDKNDQKENLKQINDPWYLRAYQSSKNLKLFLQTNYRVPNFDSDIRIPRTLIKSGILYHVEIRYFVDRKIIATDCYELDNHLAYDDSADIQNPKIYLIGAEKSFCAYDLIINAVIVGNISNSFEIQWKIREQYRNEIIILPTHSTFLLLEANTLRCGQKYEIICEVMLEMQILAMKTHIVSILKPKILLSLQTGNQSVGINQTIQIHANLEIPNDIYYKALWKCTMKETEDCGQFNDNNGTLLIKNGFSEKGLYEFELIVSGIGNHVPLKTFVKVLTGAGSVQIDKIPSYIDISNSFEIAVNITNLITGCFIYLQSINGTNYQTFNVSHIMNYNGIFMATVRRDAFLRELAPFSQTRSTEDYSFTIPGNVLRTTRDATYYLALHVQCKVPGVMDNSFYAGLMFTTNAPPKVGDFTVAPQSGDALSTMFTFKTNQASDKYMDHPIMNEFGWRYHNLTIYFTKMQEFYIYETYLPFTGEGLQTVAKICDPQNACNEIDGPIINIIFEGLNDSNYGTMQTRLSMNLFSDDYQKFQADALGFLISCREGRFEKLYDNITYTINAMLIKKSGMLQGPAVDKRSIHGFITALTLLQRELKIDERLLKNVQRLRAKLIDEQIHSSIVTDDEREALGVIDRINNRDNTTLEDIKKYFEATQFIIMTANDTNMVEMERENFINNLEKHLKHVCSLLYSQNLKRKSFDLPSGFIVVEKFKSAYFNSFSYVPNIENQWQQYIEIKFDRSWFLETRGQSLCTVKVLLHKYMNTNFVYYTHILHGKNAQRDFPNDKKVIIRKRIQNANNMQCYFRNGNNWLACRPDKTNITSTRIICECNHLGFYKISHTSADDFTPITDSNNVGEQTTAMTNDSTILQSTITTVAFTKAATEQVTNNNDNQTTSTQSSTTGNDIDDGTTTTIQTIPIITTERITSESVKPTTEFSGRVSDDQQDTSESSVNGKSTTLSGASIAITTLLSTNNIDKTDVTTIEGEIPSLITVKSTSETRFSSPETTTPETTIRQTTNPSDISNLQTTQSTIGTDITNTPSNSITTSIKNDNENTSKDQELSSDNLTTRSMNTETIISTVIVDGYDTEGNQNSKTVESTLSLLTTTLRGGVEDRTSSTIASTAQTMETTTTNLQTITDTQITDSATDSNIRTSTLGHENTSDLYITTLLSTKTVKDATDISNTENIITDSITENVKSTTDSSINLPTRRVIESSTNIIITTSTNTENTFETTVNSPTVRSGETTITTAEDKITTTDSSHDFTTNTLSNQFSTIISTLISEAENRETKMSQTQTMIDTTISTFSTDMNSKSATSTTIATDYNYHTMETNTDATTLHNTNDVTTIRNELSSNNLETTLSTGINLNVQTSVTADNIPTEISSDTTVSADTSSVTTITTSNQFSSTMITNSETLEDISTIDSNLNTRTSPTTEPKNMATRTTVDTTISYDTTNNDLTALTTLSKVSPSIINTITDSIATKSTLNTDIIDSDTTLTALGTSNSFKTTDADTNLDITTTGRPTLTVSVSGNTDPIAITTNSQLIETTTMGISVSTVTTTENEDVPSTILGSQSTMKDEGTETGSASIESSEVSTTLASNQIISTQAKSTISASTDIDQLMSTKKITVPDDVITSTSNADSSKTEIYTNSDNIPSALETSTVNTIKSAGLVNASSLSLSDQVSYIITGLSIAGIVGLIASSAIIKHLKRQRSIDAETNAPFNMYSGDIVEPENMDNFPVLR